MVKRWYFLSLLVLEQLDIYADIDLTPLATHRSEWFTDLNVKHTTIKLLADNRRKSRWL